MQIIAGLGSTSPLLSDDHDKSQEKEAPSQIIDLKRYIKYGDKKFSNEQQVRPSIQHSCFSQLQAKTTTVANTKTVANAATSKNVT